MREIFPLENLHQYSKQNVALFNLLMPNFVTFFDPRSEVINVQSRLNAQKPILIDNSVIFWNSELKFFWQNLRIVIYCMKYPNFSKKLQSQPK